MNGNAAATEPYKEIFACREAVPDPEFGDWECSCDGPCDWTFFCSACRWDTVNGPCPEHAPKDVPGLRLIGCDAEPRCARTWVLDDDGYEPPCPWCVQKAFAEAHEGCGHSHHGRWRRWRVTHWLLMKLYVLGAASSGAKWGGGCDHCVTHVRWGRNGYLLGWPRWKWHCLLVARHWPGEEVCAGLCGKCAPCPACGSERIGHDDGCEWA